MIRPTARKRLALGCALLGVLLMGVDLLLTRSVFIHVGELMAASIFCLVLALFIDRDGRPRPKTSSADEGRP